MFILRLDKMVIIALSTIILALPVSAAVGEGPSILMTGMISIVKEERDEAGMSAFTASDRFTTIKQCKIAANAMLDTFIEGHLYQVEYFKGENLSVNIRCVDLGSGEQLAQTIQLFEGYDNSSGEELRASLIALKFEI